MRFGTLQILQAVSFCLLGSHFLGCGTNANNTADTTAKPTLPTVAISNAEQGSANRAPEVGSAAWLIEQAKELRAQPMPENADLQKVQAIREQRNRKIVEMATEAIAKSHKIPEKKSTFEEAVHQLLEARLQLALLGKQADIDDFYGDVTALRDREIDSKSAADAAFTLARFAHTNARRFAKDDPRWLKEFANQAIVFATSYPQQATRAVPLLFAAGQSCELHNQPEQAKKCYGLISQQFPNTPQARQCTAMLRRLDLPGHKAEIAGPTFSGGFVSLDRTEFQNRVVLVCFWESQNERCQELMPDIAALFQKYQKHGFRVISVSLDEEEPALSAFLKEMPLPWPHIFQPKPEQRRWSAPIVQFYGLREIPALWLIDHNGLVNSTNTRPEHLEQEIRNLLSAASNAKSTSNSK